MLHTWRICDAGARCKGTGQESARSNRTQSLTGTSSLSVSLVVGTTNASAIDTLVHRLSRRGHDIDAAPTKHERCGSVHSSSLAW